MSRPMKDILSDLDSLVRDFVGADACPHDYEIDSPCAVCPNKRLCDIMHGEIPQAIMLSRKGIVEK